MQRAVQIMFVSGVSVAALGAGAAIGPAYGASARPATVGGSAIAGDAAL